MNHVEHILEGAKELVERGWTQKTFARDRMGKECAVTSPFAQKWCLAGACHHAHHFYQYRTDILWDQILSHVRKTAIDLHGDSMAKADLFVTRWNDALERTKADVLALLDAAIERAKAEEAK